MKKIDKKINRKDPNLYYGEFGAAKEKEYGNATIGDLESGPYIYNISYNMSFKFEFS